MPDPAPAAITTQQVTTGVRILLRRPSELKLPEDDIRGVLKRLLSGYAQDLKLNHRDQNTVVQEISVDEDEIDFRLRVPQTPDFEVEKLEYEIRSSNFTEKHQVVLVPYSAWPSYYDQSYVAGAVYGGDHIALNIGPQSVGSRRWILSYRPSILHTIQSEAQLPMPIDFTPMIENEAAIHCMPLVGDDSEEWIAWMNRTLPLYEGIHLRWNNPDPRNPGRWQQYLGSSVEPQVQPIRRSDRHRGGFRRLGPYIPFQ